MPEVILEIGGREFIVACQAGEEPTLRQAAALLNVEATTLQSAIGRVPENRMLLMAGLMLADRTAELGERDAEGEQNIARMTDHIHKLEARLSELAEKADQAENGVDRAQYDAAIDALAQAVARAEALSGTG